MAKKTYTYNDLMKMGRHYGVSDNPMFALACSQYITQQEVIRTIQATIDEMKDMTVKKEYVKGRENICINPLVKELPKHADSANKTLSAILDIIMKLGHEEKEETAMDKFAKRYE